MDRFQAWVVRAWAVMLGSLATGGVEAQGQDADALAWQAAQERHTYEAYQRYLDEYPVGRFAGDAFRNMIELSIDQGRAGDPDLDPAGIY